MILGKEVGMTGPDSEKAIPNPDNSNETQELAREAKEAEEVDNYHLRRLVASIRYISGGGVTICPCCNSHQEASAVRLVELEFIPPVCHTDDCAWEAAKDYLRSIAKFTDENEGNDE